MPLSVTTRLTLAATFLAAPAFAQSTPDTQAAQAYLAGARAVDAQDFLAAQRDFTQATRLSPTRQDYRLALTTVRDHRIADLIHQAATFRLSGNPGHADALLTEARLLDPTNELILQHPAATPTLPPTVNIAPTADLLFAPPIHIVPNAITTDLHLRADSKQDVTQAAQAFGIRAIFDDSVQAIPVRFDLEQTTYDEAMPILLRTAHLFAVPIDTKSIYVVKDTQENRDKYERQVEETIYVPAYTPEQLNELTQVVKSVFDIKQAAVSTNLGTITLRAPEPTIRAVNLTVHDLLDSQAQVTMEVKLITIDKTHSRNTGITTPTSYGAFSVYAEAQNLVNANQSLIQTALASGNITIPPSITSQQGIILYEAVALLASGLVTDANFTGLLGIVGHGLTTLGISEIGTTSFNFGLNASEARALDDITLQVADHQTATLRVGEKYPVTTSTYTSGLSAATTAALGSTTINGVSAASLLASASTSTIPIITYEDLGITLKAEPNVLKSGLITLKLDLKIEALTGSSLNNIPILTARNFVSTVTVEAGTSAVMISDLSRTEAASVSGIPGLANLPGFAQSAADTLRETDSTELVLEITPHLSRRRATITAGPRIPFYTSVPQDN